MTDEPGSEPTVPQPIEPTGPQGSEPVAPDPVAPPLVPPVAPQQQVASPPPGAPLVAWDAPASPPPAPPLVAWAPAPAPLTAAASGAYSGGPPPFTVGALLSDTFARYGADFPRLFLVSLVASGISWLSSFASLPAAGSNPFVRPAGFVDVSGILGLVSFVLGIVGGSTLFALAEGGRSIGLGRAIRRGVERAGWLFLTYLLLGLAFFVVFLIALIPIGLFAVMRSGLVIVPFLALFLIVIWVGLRVVLAMPATVADNLNSIEAIKLSWRVTKPTGVWARLIAAGLLLGLLFVPAAMGTVLLVFPAMFGTMLGTAGGTVPLGLVLVIPALVFSIFTPLTTLLIFSAYRRLVPPLQPSWAAPSTPPSPAIDPAVLAPAPPPPTAAFAEPAAQAAPPVPPASDAPVEPPRGVPVPPVPAASVSPGAPAFRAPKLGTAGKALLALAIAADIGGVLAIPYGVAEMVRVAQQFRGFPGLTPGTGLPGANGQVRRGQVVFAANVDLDSCTASFPLFVATPSTQVEWVAATQLPVTAQDEVFLRITRNGEELETTLQAPASYDCLGSEAPLTALQSGVYTYEVIVNGSISATGTLLVQ
jgi:hypothetical protein